MNFSKLFENQPDANYFPKSQNYENKDNRSINTELPKSSLSPVNKNSAQLEEEIEFVEQIIGNMNTNKKTTSFIEKTKVFRSLQSKNEHHLETDQDESFSIENSNNRNQSHKTTESMENSVMQASTSINTDPRSLLVGGEAKVVYLYPKELDLFQN